MSLSIALREGWIILWTGVEEDNSALEDREVLLMKLGRGLERKWMKFPVPIEDKRSRAILFKETAETPGTVLGVYPATTQQGRLRLCSVKGYGPFLDPRKNEVIGSVTRPPLRIVGMDIEQTSSMRGGNFPLPQDPLLSIAFYTWDNRRIAGYCNGTSKQEYPGDEVIEEVRLTNSRGLVKWALDWLIKDCPDFVVVHNGYSYDIPTMAAHAPRSHECLFKIVNLDRKSKGMDLQIPGITIIDSYMYLDKLHRAEYDSLSLDSLAGEVLGLSKANQPSFKVELSNEYRMDNMLYYNVHDSYLHYKVAISTGLIDEIVSLCTVSRSPLADVTRYITGSMASTLIASFAYFNNESLDWSSESPSYGKYKGGLVMDPIKGIHRQVMVFDVQSMYPTVMTDLNISPETVSILQPDDSILTSMKWVSVEPSVYWHFGNKFVIMKDESTIVKVTGPDTKIGLVTQALKTLVSKRLEVGKKTPYGLACKILANSMYGALGAKTGLLQCRQGASMVTAGGRFVLRKAQEVASKLGYEVVYGDTDSVFLACTNSKLSPDPEGYLSALGKELEETPFKGIKLDLEEVFESIVLLRPKMYYGISTEGAVKVRGIASVRRDRPLLVRNTTEMICKVLCFEDSKRAPLVLSTIAFDVYRRITNEDYVIREASFEIRKAGIVYHSFKDDSGQYQMLRTDKESEDVVLPSSKWLVERVSSACDSILVPCDLPTFRNLVNQGAKLV